MAPGPRPVHGELRMKTFILFLCFCLPLYAADYATTFEGEANPGVVTNFADSTDQACSGTESFKSTDSVGGVFGVTFTGVSLVHWGGYVYLDSLPASTDRIASGATSGGTSRCTFDLEPDGTITVGIAGGTPAASPAISTGTWVYLEFKCDVAPSAGSDVVELRINEVVAVTVSNGSVSANSIARGFALASHNTGATYWDDYYVHDTTAAYRGYSAGCGDVSGGGGSSKRKAMVVGD